MNIKEIFLKQAKIHYIISDAIIYISTYVLAHANDCVRSLRKHTMHPSKVSSIETSGKRTHKTWIHSIQCIATNSYNNLDRSYFNNGKRLVQGGPIDPWISE